ncbi:hypothetical protein R8Z50_01205 [Longispora sp. K20-0274]|uniref:hypothetical protein n=1 Tax=Longispora sp. K20-0274 TaxID=3088255 RepID=UPI00399A54FD
MWRTGLLCIAVGAGAEVIGLALPWNEGMSLATVLTWPSVEANRLPLGLVGAVATFGLALWVLSGRGPLGRRRALLAAMGIVQFCGLFSLLLISDAAGVWAFAAGSAGVLLGGLIAYRTNPSAEELGTR